MVALLPRGLIGGLAEDPDAVSYPESKHASPSVPQTACAQLYRLVSMLTASLDDFSIFGADLGAQMAQGDGAETDLCVLLTDWRAGGAGGTPGATTGVVGNMGDWRSQFPILSSTPQSLPRR